MNIAQIEENLQQLVNTFSKNEFIYDFLTIYGFPNSSIARLKNGNMNMSKVSGEINIKKKIYYKQDYSFDLNATLEAMTANLKHKQRFAVITDFNVLLAVDAKTKDKLDIEFKNLHKHFDFFLPLAGIEKTNHRDENVADVKAADRMAKLYDIIKKDNPDETNEFIHSLNVFLSRLLFCYFAEDTGIFKENQFINNLASHTSIDGGDLKYWFNSFFKVLNTPENERHKASEYLKEFPYVNGGLFGKDIKAPKFSRRSRQAIIDGGGNNQWAEINPDIFGSMFQAVIGVDQRGSLGQHYTSVPNIMKVIEPLFLNELYEAFEQAKNEPRKLKDLLFRLSKIKIFDPACGSGNFLIIAYKELRRLEIKIILRLLELQKIANTFRGKEEQLELIPKSQLSLAASYQIELFSHISLSQFYGIEIDDFAHEVAMLALWLAEHQMNVEFNKQFHRNNPTLPLKEAGNIVQGNACRLKWEDVCPKKEGDEIYVLGNPPYLGSRNQNNTQKADLKFVFKKDYKSLDYISAWFYKGAEYIKNSNSSMAFVSTNSITQGEQVALLWERIFSFSLEISFAHQTFAWENNAKSKAAVFVIIVGLRNKSNKEKYIYRKGQKETVANINPYLTTAKSSFIYRRSKPLCEIFNKIVYGNLLNDGGHLVLNKEEKDALIKESLQSSKFIKRYIGSKEFLRGEVRWCIYIKDKELDQAQEIFSIKHRLENVKNHRIKSTEKSTRAVAEYPNRFYFQSYNETNSIIIPRTSSERREYIPMGFLGTEIIISDAAQAIYNAEPWILGMLSSKIHMAWVKAVAGRLKSDYRYSSAICYNTFPFPNISAQRKEELTQCVFRILEEREKHSDKTLAQLYDPDKMPEGLREAHRLNDLAVERCYRSKPFESDEERLEYLFKLYEKMIAEEKEKSN